MKRIEAMMCLQPQCHPQTQLGWDTRELDMYVPLLVHIPRGCFLLMSHCSWCCFPLRMQGAHAMVLGPWLVWWLEPWTQFKAICDMAAGIKVNWVEPVKGSGLGVVCVCGQNAGKWHVEGYSQALCAFCCCTLSHVSLIFKECHGCWV